MTNSSKPPAPAVESGEIEAIRFRHEGSKKYRAHYAPLGGNAPYKEREILLAEIDRLRSTRTAVEVTEERVDAVAAAIFNVFAKNSNINIFPWPEQDQDDYREAARAALAAQEGR